MEVDKAALLPHFVGKVIEAQRDEVTDTHYSHPALSLTSHRTVTETVSN